MMKKIALSLLGLNILVGMAILAVEMLASPDEPPPIDEDVPGLELLSERASQPGSVTVGQPHDASSRHDEAGGGAVAETAHENGPVVQAAAAEPEICLSVGPFADEGLAEQAAEVLKQHGLATELRTEWHDEFFGYWVYLPPYPSREAAVAVTRELKLHGIEDFFIVLASARQNAISLGVYRNHDTAINLQKRLKSMDFDARIERRMRSRAEYWLDYQGHLRPGEAVLSRLKKDHPRAQVRQHACIPAAE